MSTLREVRSLVLSQASWLLSSWEWSCDCLAPGQMGSGVTDTFCFICFHVGSGHLNSAPHILTASALLTELSPQLPKKYTHIIHTHTDTHTTIVVASGSSESKPLAYSTAAVSKQRTLQQLWAAEGSKTCRWSLWCQGEGCLWFQRWEGVF